MQDAVRRGERVVIDDFADRWALVTGASSGIGAEFAHRLAARGMHLVLVARRLDRLQQLAEELHTRHGTLCETIDADLADPSQAKRVIDTISERGRTIELLVNNAGFAVVGDISSTDVDSVMALTRLNIGAATELTYRLLPGMIERGHGAIINVSSVAAFQPVTYMSAYAASKAYLLHLSEALWAEARDFGVTVMALCPGPTETEFFNVAGVPGWLKKQGAHTAEQVVRKALKALEKKKPVVVTGLKSYLRSLLVRIASRKRVVIESMKYFRPQAPDKAAEKDADSSAEASPPHDHSSSETPAI